MINKTYLLFPPLYLPPLIGIAISYITGIAIYALRPCWTGNYFTYLVGIASIFSIAIAYHHNREHFKKIALSIFFLVLGYWRSHTCYTTFEKFPFHDYKEPVSVRGVITGSSYSSKGRMKHCLTLYAQETKDKNNKIKNFNGELQIYLNEKPKIYVGDQIEIHNVKITRPGSNAFKEYLIKEGILSSLFITNFSYNVLYQPKYSIHRWLWQTREQLVQNLSRKLSPQVHAFFCAIFLGNRAIAKNEVESISDQFKQWGAVHYMVRAGLHLVMFVGIWFSLLTFIPISFNAKQILMILICLLYYLLSWSSIAFLRAFLTFLLYKGASLFNLNTHSLHIITLVTLVVLLANPMQLFFLDFQLSFSVTFALAWFNHMYISPPAQPL